MGVLSLVVSVIVLLLTQRSMSGALGIVFAAAVVAFVLVVGLLFDMVGVAVAAAPAEPFHARAARDHAGATQSLRLLRNADKVANFCLDFVGDVAGTLTGALATAAAYRLAGGGDVELWGALAVGTVAGANVGLKAVAKAVALADDVAVVRLAGEVLSWTERLGLPPILAGPRRRRGPR
jgi:Mg2+/Co2+ transporter CorB